MMELVCTSPLCHLEPKKTIMNKRLQRYKFGIINVPDSIEWVEFELRFEGEAKLEVAWAELKERGKTYAIKTKTNSSGGFLVETRHLHSLLLTNRGKPGDTITISFRPQGATTWFHRTVALAGSNKGSRPCMESKSIMHH